MKAQGLYTALVTPFRNGRVDEESFQQLIEQQIAAEVSGIVPVGTTGESPVLSAEEHLRVIEMAVQFSAGRTVVIAGTGSNSTEEAIALTCEAEQVGATGSLQVAPYYNRPSQEGLYQHFRSIAQATKLPIILYNVPSRCGVEIGVETVASLARDCPNIIAIKEAGGDVDRVNKLVQATANGFSILSGDDGLALPFMACGGMGLISVASNLIPAQMKALIDACLTMDYTLAQRLQKQLYPLLTALMSIERNPIPIKAAMALTGIMTSEIRLPMVALSSEKTETLAHMMRAYGLLKG